MALITVVGAGVMGTALMFPAADNGHDIRLVGTHLDDDIIQSCQDRRFHPTLKRAIPANIQPYFHTQIAEMVPGAEIVVVGVNSRGVDWVAEAIGPHIRPGQIILMITKGLAGDADGNLQVLPDYLHDHLPPAVRDHVHYAAVGGPSIAGELAARRD
ncbi:MAG: glycerol-3-phosphate dehydrogenase, partial [Chloroflexi bacterium]|nr:glycerol-3-phosphate dehydrogenase [Chloroflexota bacterium]